MRKRLVKNNQSTIDKEELLKVLNKLKPALSREDYLPILNNFCFVGNYVYAYNDFLAIQFNYATGLNCAVHGETLLKYLSSVSTSKIEYSKTEEELLIKAGRSSLKLPSLGKENFILKLPDISKFDKYIYIDENFIKALKLCLISVSDDPGHPEHNGIIVEGDGSGVITIYSTDNFTISKCVINPDNLNDEINETVVTIPKAFCEQLITLYNDFVSDVYLYIGDDCVVASDEVNYLFSKLMNQGSSDPINSVLKEYEEAFSKQKKYKITENLITAFNHCLIVLNNTLDKICSVSLSNDLLTIEATGLGNVKDKVKLEAVNKIKSSKQLEMKLPTDLILRACGVSDYIIFSEEVVIFGKDDFIHLVAQVN